MKITYKGDYALKAVLDLAKNYNQGLLTINDIATHIDAPIKFLEQVLLELKRGGFVESRRGNVGGYLLARSPAEITVGDVVRFVDGPTEPIACVKEGYSQCGDVYKCVFRKIWQDVSQATSDIIDNINFEQLALQLDAEQKVIAYAI
ncbi:MAG: Rrf2 family transcriptional regulator [Candidatus Omnitrophica bacterium]|nr:Rrf2 family transcriptional regulator [Candidatus Omnitrophota bacterium]